MFPISGRVNSNQNKGLDRDRELLIARVKVMACAMKIDELNDLVAIAERSLEGQELHENALAKDNIEV